MDWKAALCDKTISLALIGLLTLGACGSEDDPSNGAASPATGGSEASTGGDSSTGGAVVGSGGDSSTGGTQPDDEPDDEESFVLSSPSWDAVDNDDCTPDAPASCPLYPEENTFFGDNVSPAMSWTAGPEETQSYAIVLTDLSNGMVHWVLWDVPASTTSLPAELPGGALDAPSGAQQAGFGFPPAYFGSGACGNVYEHRLYALGVAQLEPGTTDAEEVRDAILDSGAILAESFVRLQSREYCTIED